MAEKLGAALQKLIDGSITRSRLQKILPIYLNNAIV